MRNKRGCICVDGTSREVVLEFLLSTGHQIQQRHPLSVVLVAIIHRLRIFVPVFLLVIAFPIQRCLNVHIPKHGDHTAEPYTPPRRPARLHARGRKRDRGGDDRRGVRRRIVRGGEVHWRERAAEGRKFERRVRTRHRARGGGRIEGVVRGLPPERHFRLCLARGEGGVLIGIVIERGLAA